MGGCLWASPINVVPVEKNLLYTYVYIRRVINLGLPNLSYSSYICIIIFII